MKKKQGGHAILSVLLHSLKTLLLFMMLGAPGFVLGKTQRIKQEALGSVGHILLDVSLPTLVFSKLLDTDLSSLSGIALLFCVVCPVVTVTAVLLLGKLLLLPFKGDRAICLLCGAFSNCGFMGIPLAGILFPDDSWVTVYVSLFNTVSSLLLLTVGAGLVSGKRQAAVKTALLSPMTVAFALGVLGSALNVSTAVPGLVTLTGYLGAMATPLSMTVLGFELSQLTLRNTPRRIGFAVTTFLKLIASPLVAGLLMAGLAAVGVPLSRTLVYGMTIACAVPTAASAPSLAEQHGHDGQVTSVLTLGNTLLSMVTLPLIFTLLDILFKFS